MNATPEFHADVLEIDCQATVDRIAAETRRMLSKDLRRRGIVVAVSGGVDSAVCAALAARAVGPRRVVGLLLPERDSAGDSSKLGRLVCETFGIRCLEFDISATLEALGCYANRDAAVQRVFPDYGPGWGVKIAIAGDLLDSDRLNYFHLVVRSPDGETRRERAPLDTYLQVVAATNMKQRTRKLVEYYHAESLNYAVLGTPNRLEYELGFFVRGGDGLADFKPIGELFKTQVYALARYLDVPKAVWSQPATTDTYSLPQTQEEFFFGLPYREMDLLLYAHGHGVAAERAGAVVGLTAEQVERVCRDIEAKRRMADRLLRPAPTIGGLPG